VTDPGNDKCGSYASVARNGLRCNVLPLRLGCYMFISEPREVRRSSRAVLFRRRRRRPPSGQNGFLSGKRGAMFLDILMLPLGTAPAIGAPNPTWLRVGAALDLGG
jgi:hypothetical protein